MISSIRQTLYRLFLVIPSILQRLTRYFYLLSQTKNDKKSLLTLSYTRNNKINSLSLINLVK